MNTASGRLVWAFISRRSSHPPEDRYEPELQFYDDRLTKYNFSVLIKQEPERGRGTIEIYPSDKKVWTHDVTLESCARLQRGKNDPSTPWPVAVAAFVDANRPAFESMDADVPRDKLLRTNFIDRVANTIKLEGVKVLAQLEITANQNLSPERRLEVVHFMGPNMFADTPFYRLGLYADNFDFKIVLNVIPDEVVIGFKGATSGPNQIRLTSGPVYEAANKLTKVLRDAPPVGNEIRYVSRLEGPISSAEEGKEWTGRRFYHFYRQSAFDEKAVQRTPAYEHPDFTDDRILPAEAEEPLQALHTLLVEPPSFRDHAYWATNLKSLPEVLVQYLDGTSEQRSAEDLVLLPTSNTPDDVAAGLELDVQGSRIEEFGIFDNENNYQPLEGLGDILSALATPPHEVSLFVKFNDELNDPFIDLAA